MLSAAGFIGGLGNYAFQGIIGRQLGKAEFGYVNSTLGFVNLMSLPLMIVATSLVHYIAHFRATDNEAHLQGLLLGSQRFLLKATIFGTLLALLLANPLGQYFEFPRTSLMLAALVCVLVGMWSSFALALAQGMSWFQRMAIVGLVAVGLRLAFGWIATTQFSKSAELAVSATTFSLLANFALLFWWKELFKKGESISPWNREFLSHLIFSAACVGGTYFFTQGDLLVAQKHFQGEQLGNYMAAGVLGRALTALVGPMLSVLFTSRSGGKTAAAATDQRVMLALYAGGLVCGAIGVIVLRDLLVRFIFGKYTPEAAAMVIRFSIAMVFIGLIQAIGTWSLASRWFKLALFYGVLGVAYWLTLLLWGTTPESLLQIMTIGGGVAFVSMLIGWVITTREVKPVP
jgi:O-antigen/teichoic acid export membrane protein